MVACSAHKSRESSVAVLPDEQKSMEIFRQLDKNGDGVLSKRELRLAFERWGARFPGMSYFRAHRGLNYADGNNDGSIDEAEFGYLLRYAFERGYKVK